MNCIICKDDITGRHLLWLCKKNCYVAGLSDAAEQAAEQATEPLDDTEKTLFIRISERSNLKRIDKP